jgi:hypothetical protein
LLEVMNVRVGREAIGGIDGVEVIQRSKDVPGGLGKKTRASWRILIFGLEEERDVGMEDHRFIGKVCRA